MKLILPVSDVDIVRAKMLAQRLVSLGWMDDVHVIVISTMRAAWDIGPLIDTLKPGFREVTLHVLRDEEESGWPESANHLFFKGCEFLSEFYDDEPFYWFEADCFPTRKSWWAEIQAAYAVGGKPYMGFINVSRYYDRETNEEIIDGKHMVGTGIYPAHFLGTNDRIHLLIRHPWDVYIGPEVTPQCLHTDLIAHRWNTCNYRCRDGKLICDNGPHQWHQYAAPVPPEAAVIHGCKDLSLYALFTTELEQVSSPRPNDQT